MASINLPRKCERTTSTGFGHSISFIDGAAEGNSEESDDLIRDGGGAGNHNPHTTSKQCPDLLEDNSIKQGILTEDTSASRHATMESANMHVNRAAVISGQIVLL